MNFYNKKLYILGSFLFIIVGIKIIYTKTISQGNAAMGGEKIYIGNFGYLVGGIFVIIGVIALYNIYKKRKKVSDPK